MYSVKADISNISEAVQFIEKQLSERGCKKDRLMRTVLLSEEILVQMIKNANEDAEISIDFVGKGKRCSVEIKCKGEKFNISDSVNLNMLTDADTDDLYDEEQSSVISDLILRSHSSDISYKHVKGLNRASIKFPKEKTSNIIFTLSCLAAGLLVGLIFKFAIPEAVTTFFSENIFGLITSIFFRGISFVVAPLVFFSIAESALGFSDMKAFGRIGAKVMGTYVVTTLFAVGIGYMMSCLLQPGDPVLLSFVEKISNTSTATVTMEISISLKDTILGMIPSNFIGPFAEGNMIQIIVIALILGFASKAIGDYSEPVKRFIKTGNALFSQIITYIVQLLPITIFCVMAKLMITIDFATVDKILAIILTAVASTALMYVVYSLILLIVAKVNPLKFWANHKDALIFAFSSCSSSATMPYSMKCLDRAGVSPVIYSFSIPLGATVNMDGASIAFIVTTLAMARIYGIELSSGALFSLFISILLLSIGVPGVVGAGVACSMLLFAQVGIPVGAIAFIIPISTIIEFFDTMANVSGDAVVTTAVARTEGLFNNKLK